MSAVGKTETGIRPGRMGELDVLRGFAVSVMILVVSPGAWEFTYAQLRHADWHGWTFADFVFPDFLFGVGMALGLTFGKSLDPATGRVFWKKVGRPVGLLVLLGLALNYLAVIAGMLGARSAGPYGQTTFRIRGVLQRIALCYFLAVTAVMFASVRGSARVRPPRPLPITATIVAILLGYWAALSFVRVPGFGGGSLDMAGNLPAYVDRAIFTPRHMLPLGAQSWRGPVLYDPEGLLSTLPATATVLCGVLAVNIWRDRSDRRVAWLSLAGIGMIAAALAFDPVFPINKKLWTSSFVLLTAGLSCLALVVVAGLLRFRSSRTALAPLELLGGNAILAFSISIVLSALGSIPLHFGAESKTLQQVGFGVAQRAIADPYLASLACAFGVLGFVALLIWPLHRRGIHLRL